MAADSAHLTVSRRSIGVSIGCDGDWEGMVWRERWASPCTADPSDPAVPGATALGQAMPDEEEEAEAVEEQGEEEEAVAVVAWGGGRNLGRLGPLSC